MFLATTVDKIESYWRNMLLAICKPIYQLIVYLYELFEVVGTAEILTNDTLTTIYNRVGMLLGVYMMFRIIFSFIQMLINPDYISDKEKGVGKIASKTVLTILLIGITPFLFEKAIEFQNFVVGVNSGENIIANVLLPSGSSSKGGERVFGSELSAYLFESFYRYDRNMLASGEDGDCEALLPEDGVTRLHKSIMWSGGDISYAKSCLDENWTDEQDEKIEKYEITFTSNGVFAIIVGIIACYILLTYVLMAGVRVIQLAFLRIISPMAILTYMSPKKDTMFSKWLKMCTTTYLDLFIRMAIIYFAIFIIQAIMSGNGIALQNSEFEHQWIVNIVMIIALLIFAKKAPELLKELFPSSGAASLGFFSSPKKLFNSMIGGGMINKGLSSIGKTMKKAPGNYARQMMGRRDVIKHGGTRAEARAKYPGFFGRKRINWMKDNAPLAYKEYENRISGNQELAEMHNNWIKGDQIRQNIIRKFGVKNPDEWDKKFDGKSSDPYNFVYGNKDFAKSVQKVDFEKDKMKVFGSIHTGLSASSTETLATLLRKGSITDTQAQMVRDMMPGKTDDKIDATSFYSTYEKQQKIVAAVEKTHDSLRKVYADDASVEDQISVRKNNPYDPSGR